MARLVRHRQPKGPETDMPSLKPPRHISTLRALKRGSHGHAMREQINLTDAPTMFGDTVGAGSIFHESRRARIPATFLKSW